MRYNLICCILLWLTTLSVVTSAGKTDPGKSPLFLFSDRTWAISGDTIWFSVFYASPSDAQGNVVHVQLEDQYNELVNRVMVITKEGAGIGYIPIPDSLGSGAYWLRAYTNTMRNSPQISTISRILTVYHRFDEQITSANMPDGLDSISLVGLDNLEVIIRESEVKTRGEVHVDIHFPEEAKNLFREMYVDAYLTGPSAEIPDRFYLTPLVSQSPPGAVDFPAELNGFFVEGRVIPATGDTLPSRSLVLLSISDSIPHFDYYLANKNGYFRFKLKNAFGRAQIYIRAIAGEGQELSVELTKGIMKGEVSANLSQVNFTEERQKFVKQMLEADWYSRVFTPAKNFEVPLFKMTPRFGKAFYGIPDRRVVPAEFVNLPDFWEISREILPAVKFRSREDKFSLQILDNLENKYFEKSPLRLINGIPVFDDNLLYRFKSSDIRYIDLIYQERIFADISFKGVLAIVLNDGNENWLSEQKNLFSFTIPCLQIPQDPSYNLVSDVSADINIPDFRRVFLFKRIESADDQTFSFRVSDLKGSVIVRLQGVTVENEPFEIIRKILVQ